MQEKSKRVLVAMSGGLDSTVAAFLLQQQGHDVQGITMAFGAIAGTNPNSPVDEAVPEASSMCRKLGIEHHTIAMGDYLEKYVIENFLSEYLNGRTPNPCARCNRYVKFGELLKAAEDLKCDYLATGHYVYKVFDEEQQIYHLKKAKDLKKDQSYFLYTLSQSVLARVLFPLGLLTKDDVRGVARLNGFESVARRSESQDICFISDQGYKNFIGVRKTNENYPCGDFKNEKGEVVGQHKGLINYTIGQRDKLGLALGVPVYVYQLDRATNTVYVGPKGCLLRKGLYARDACFVSGKSFKGKIDASVRIRYNAPDMAAKISALSSDHVKVEFAQPQLAVTPGQCVVFYHDDCVLGGGIIEKAIEEDA
ncbi:MAG: tRNA 2-thiouridine(34) synthase MnmA [Candidatus Omnitrophica bacterium]|nr:tRNA 2-thiouridine(34) synthase MnmA [Candidatus Omnitrophota bacterium]